MSKVLRHDNAYDPVANFALNGDLGDISGNVYDLQNVYSQEIYADLVPGIRSLWCAQDFGFYRGSYDAALNITGDLTVSCMATLREHASGTYNMIVAAFGAAGSTEADNYTWAIGFRHNQVYRMYAYHEYGVSNLDSFTADDGCACSAQPNHYVWRRQSDVYTFFCNGQQVGSASSALNTPTGGTSGKLLVSGTGASAISEDFVGCLSSLVIWDQALSDAQCQSLFTNTLGQLYPRRSA